MDMYGLSAQDCFRIDDLLDFSNDDLFSPSSASAADAADLHHHLPQLPPTTSSSSSSAFSTPTDFTNDLSVPSDDAAELEWLSRFVDDSFSDFPTGENVVGLAAAMFPNDASFSARARSKRSRAPVSASAGSWTAATEVKPKSKREVSSPTEAAGGGVRRCTHCASEKTPQWRTGPMGPKTLCNACGVRYKSGRLVPEYRPAASPTFVLTQHSNSHRKVLELRRQKELQLQRQQQPPPPPPPPEQKQEQFYPHHHGFRVC